MESKRILILKKNTKLIANFKTKIKELKVKQLISEIEKLILEINQKGLREALYSFKEIKKEKNNNEEEMFNKLLDLDENIKNISELMLKKNPIIFKLELYKPKIYELTIEQLIVWIYKVEIKEEKLKMDNKKQFYYLIYKFQKEEKLEIKQSILLELLYKIQLYIKYAK